MGKIILNGVVYTVDVDINNETPTFTEAQTRTNIQSGENVSTLFGKIKKWFADLPNMFVSKSSGGAFGGNVTVDRADGTTVTDGTSEIAAGNPTPSGTTGNSYGILRLWGKGNKSTALIAPDATGTRTIIFPNASGTVALDNEVVFDITSFKNGWTGNIRVTHNKNTKITSLSGYLNGTNATSNVFADATTDGNNATKIPVAVQGLSLIPNQMVTNYPISFSQVSGNNWSASIDKSVGTVAVCIVYVSAA